MPLFAPVRKRPESVVMGRDPKVLHDLLNFYAKPKAQVLDCTANTRKMWNGVHWDGEIVYVDIDPTMKPDVVADFRCLPFVSESFDVLIFDPPHLPLAASSPKSYKRFVRDYGLAKSLPGDCISAFFPSFLQEAHRVLKPDGLIFAKLKDFVHNHRYQWTLVDFISTVRGTPGLTACDLTIKRDPCGGSLKSGRWVQSHHARNVHCWWVVVRKGKCEPRKS